MPPTWTVTSINFDRKTASGRFWYRIILYDAGAQQCRFLEYAEEPTAAILEEHSAAIVAELNTILEVPDNG